jgi:hypothetical protein
MVRIYTQGPAGWSQIQALTGPPGSRFGVSVALGDHWLVVGAPEDGAAHEGAAYLYSTTTFGLERILRPGDGRLNDRFGAAVAVDGNTVVVGAPYADDLHVFYNFGAVYVFESGSQIAKLRSDPAFRPGDIQFGSSVAIRGNQIVVGAPGDDPDHQESAGSAYLFTNGQNGWERTAELTHADPTPGRQLGVSVAIDANRIAVGALGDGAAYYFKTDGQPDGECGCGGPFGRSVALRLGSAFLGDPGGVKGCFEVVNDGVCPLAEGPGIRGRIEGDFPTVVSKEEITYRLRLENPTSTPLPNGGGPELEHGIPRELRLLSAKVLAGGGRLRQPPKPSGDPTVSLWWNGAIPPCGTVDLQVKAQVVYDPGKEAQRVCLEATVKDLDGRQLPVAPYCFQIVPQTALSPSGGR